MDTQALNIVTGRPFLAISRFVTTNLVQKSQVSGWVDIVEIHLEVVVRAEALCVRACGKESVRSKQTRYQTAMNDDSV